MDMVIWYPEFHSDLWTSFWKPVKTDSTITITETTRAINRKESLVPRLKITVLPWPRKYLMATKISRKMELSMFSSRAQKRSGSSRKLLENI